MYYVYKHTTPNNKVYIGITRRIPERRWGKNGNGYIKNQYFTNAILKYGWDNIEHEILFTNLTKEEAEQKEIELIKKHKSNKRKYGYNIESGGNSTKNLSDETKRKISIAHKGKKLSEEHRKNLSISHKGYGHGGFAKNRIVPEEVRVKIGKSHCVPIMCLQTGKIYKSGVEASNDLNLSRSEISQNLHNKRKQIRGYSFVYVNKEVQL